MGGAYLPKYLSNPWPKPKNLAGSDGIKRSNITERKCIREKTILKIGGVALSLNFNL